WTGTPLFDVLKASGILPKARYLVYFSIDPDWWESIDMADVQHPQTLLAWGMNDGDLPVAFGGPLRLRVPRQLGYKSVKFVNRLMVTDSRKGFVSALEFFNSHRRYHSLTFSPRSALRPMSKKICTHLRLPDAHREFLLR
ncbi:MAG: hypothetical protein DMG97_22465, partial [Acidobacteria bacterium]